MLVEYEPQAGSEIISAKFPTEGYGSMGVIEIDLFPEDVDSRDHPDAVNFRRLLEEVAGEYDCRLLSYEVERGTVSFSFDDDGLTAEVLKLLRQR